MIEEYNPDDEVLEDEWEGYITLTPEEMEEWCETHSD